MFAHHPFENEFDKTKFVTLTGTVTKVEWMNPHSNLYVEVKDPEGKVASWTLELGGPDLLTKSGWTRDSVKQGDRVEASPWVPAQTLPPKPPTSFCSETIFWSS